MPTRSLLLLGLLHSTDGFAPSSGPMRPVVCPRSRDIVASGQVEAVNMERDSLMQRTVEQQLSAFAFVHDHTKQRYLMQQWEGFLEHLGTQRQSAGQLTAFLGHLQCAEPSKIFVPKRSFRGLSPGNPYAKANTDGDYEEVHPKTLMLRLMSCREQLAEDWLKLVPEITELTKLIEAKDLDAPATATAAVGSTGEGSRDRQLLFGIATKVAARQMLHELKCRPSCKHLHEWLVSYLLVQHAADLTAQVCMRAQQSAPKLAQVEGFIRSNRPLLHRDDMQNADKALKRGRMALLKSDDVANLREVITLLSEEHDRLNTLISSQ